jgi:hypothetical protein
VLSLLTTTVAPGTNPPPESTTTPVIDEVAVPCADADVLMNANRSTAAMLLRHLLRISSPSKQDVPSVHRA